MSINRSLKLASRQSHAVSPRRYRLAVLLSFLVFYVQGQAQPVVVEAGPHERVWQVKTTEIDESGQAVETVGQWTEVATGLNFWLWNAATGTGHWEESTPVFELSPQGYALALRGQHKVILDLGNLNHGGSVDLELPDGQERLLSNPMGLAFSAYPVAKMS
jgi:hypothetical protein